MDMSVLCAFDDGLMPRRGTAPAPLAGVAFNRPNGGALWLAGEPTLSAKGASGDFNVAAKDMKDVLQWLHSDASTMSGFDTDINDDLAVEDVPMWCGKGYTHACRTIRTFARPAELRTTVDGILRDGSLPWECQASEAWMIQGTTFVDYVAIGVEVRFFVDADEGCVLLCRHTSLNDIVRFSRHVAQLKAHLQLKGISVCDLPTGAESEDIQRQVPGEEFEDDFVDDFDDDDDNGTDAPWASRIAAMLQDVGRGCASLRAEAWQALALCGQNSCASRSHLAQALLQAPKGSSAVAALLKAGHAAPIAEMYPMVTALKFAAPWLDPSNLSVELACLLASENFSPLVAAELGEVRRGLKLPLSGPHTTDALPLSTLPSATGVCADKKCEYVVVLRGGQHVVALRGGEHVASRHSPGQTPTPCR